MSQKVCRKVLQVEGMTCGACELKIEKNLKKLEGVLEVKAIFSSSNVYVTYDVEQIRLDGIIEAVEKLDYKVKNKPSASVSPATSSGASVAAGPAAGQAAGGKSARMTATQFIGLAVILLAVYLIINRMGGFNFIPQVDQSMGYGVLFVVGLITSLHCIAMCGGINLSQCVNSRYAAPENEGAETGRVSRLKPSLLYNAGRVISYTVIGGLVGALGSAVSFSGTAKGIVAILSGGFMVIMGLNMMNIFPWLRKLNPRIPKFLGRRVYESRDSKGPFYVGLLNGLMPCGPLQAMQIYALGTGSALAGALSMLLFSLGTVPLMFGLGALSSILSSRFTTRMMKVSAMLVMILGIVMLGRGLNLSGIGFPGVNLPGIGSVYASSASTANVAKVEGEVQTVTMKMESGRYRPIVVQKGIPVRWVIQADKKDLNGCNNPVTIPRYDIVKRLVPGDNVIEFIPEEEGNITYTCWMGMISSTILVVDDVSNVTEEELNREGSGGGPLGPELNPGGGGGMGCCGG